jgi:hypothetical protein
VVFSRCVPCALSISTPWSVLFFTFVRSIAVSLLYPDTETPTRLFSTVLSRRLLLELAEPSTTPAPTWSALVVAVTSLFELDSSRMPSRSLSVTVVAVMLELSTERKSIPTALVFSTEVSVTVPSVTPTYLIAVP